MKLQTLSAELRTTRKKSSARKQRLNGQLPAVVYGEGQDPVALLVSTSDFTKIIHGAGGEHAVVQLEIEGQPELNGPTMLRQVQHHPVKDLILHADFQRIRLDRVIATYVPIHLTGKPKGVVEGGVIDYQLREIEVECLALDVPEYIEIDTTHLEVGDSLHVSDLQAPEKVKITTDPERAIVTVLAPRVLVEAEEGAEEEAAEGEEAEGEGEGESEESEG